MNVFFDGYTIINERPPENGLKVFSAKHDQTSKPVIIYFLPIDQKSPLLQKNIYHDYLPLRKIISKHVVRVYDIEEIDEPTASGIVFIREDISGIRLKEYINKKTHIPVDRFLNIALQLVTAICDLHQNGFIHKRLTSSSIVIDPDLIHVSIRDFNFGKSSLLDQTLLIRKDKEKTRAADELIYYISPEQTGRMNRAVDYRTDFYSLGIIFYELLCGTLPFIDENPIKIFHSHMAQKPAPPAEVRNDVDDAVSQIIMKLLSKSPEDRYQSGYGIKYDLNVCFQQFSAHSRIQPFAPASKDISEVFRIPEKIYGRDSEISRLADKYSQIKQGQLGFTVITGPSGIGKTRLIHEFRKYIVNSGGYFISGRYEKNQQNIPYSALIQAFNELIRQILTESSDHIHDWRQKLSTALGVNAQVLIDIFPDLELIIGKQPVVSELSPSDSLNRLHMVFDKFIQVFASKKHPLTLFIDDMQWADSDGLKLMEAFFAGTKSRYFYSISAYTNNGIIKQHQLVQSLDIINNKGIHIHNVILEPITEIDVCQLIADILQEKINNVKLLAKIVHNKTRGNPFFIRQLLHSLNDKDLLSYNCKTGRWQWNIEQIAAATISDKMIDFMTAKHIKELTDNAQHILKLAACIGNRFNISDLSIIAGKSQNEILADLWEAIELGFVKTKGDIYQHLFKPSGKIQASAGSKFEAADDIYFDFLHDRVRQTVYSHITDGQ
ncbi:MAG: AAA family ATPase, partial [Desulfobacteraceae bacterium]|nr:AAA family ATPase [Desulfobacteraceae bacterium]